MLQNNNLNVFVLFFVSDMLITIQLSVLALKCCIQKILIFYSFSLFYCSEQYNSTAELRASFSCALLITEYFSLYSVFNVQSFNSRHIVDKTSLPAHVHLPSC